MTDGHVTCPATIRCLELLVDVLDTLRDLLEANNQLHAYESLLKQASESACEPYEDRKYRIVKVTE